MVSGEDEVPGGSEGTLQECWHSVFLIYFKNNDWLNLGTTLESDITMETFKLLAHIVWTEIQ